MVVHSYKSVISPFILGRYLQLEGKWTVGSLSPIAHDSLLDAKRACFQNEYCYGVRASGISSTAYSEEFPVEMSLRRDWFIHQKETLLGIFIYNKRYKDLNSYLYRVILFLFCFIFFYIFLSQLPRTLQLSTKIKVSLYFQFSNGMN